jgi:hypothetical protein
VEKQWRNSGETVEKQWRNSGETVEKQWRNSGETVEQQWSPVIRLEWWRIGLGFGGLGRLVEEFGRELGGIGKGWAVHVGRDRMKEEMKVV